MEKIIQIISDNGNIYGLDEVGNLYIWGDNYEEWERRDKEWKDKRNKMISTIRIQTLETRPSLKHGWKLMPDELNV